MRRLACLSGMLALLVCLTAPVSAQETRGSIEGIVKDTSGAVLPGVTVEARSPALVGVATAVTDANGIYRFPALDPGRYEVTATLAGFQTTKFENLQLQIGQVLKADFSLNVSGVSESVQVTAGSPLIDVKQNSASATISSEIIERIPKGRDYTSVITSAPGANDESRAGGFSIDGSSGSENRYIVDGMDRTNLRTGLSTAQNSNSTVLTDFLSDVKVQSSGYTAEYAGATGGVISAVTKSGSNAFHGSMGTYFRNQDLQGDLRGSWRINPVDNVSPEFLTTPDDKFATWSPVGDIGGPVLKDRLWFYMGYSYNRTDNERTARFRNSPNAAEVRTFNWWSSSDYYNWNVSSQLSKSMRFRFSGVNNRSRNRKTAPALQPDGSKFADGTATDGTTTAAWDATDEAFKDRWDRVGNNGRNDQYSGNLDWVVTPQFFVNLQSGYLAYDQYSPAEFAGNQILHSFAQSNICVGAAGGATCPFPQIPSNLQFQSGYTDNKNSNRAVQDLYTRSYVNVNSSWFTHLFGEHQVKFGLRFERLGNKVNSGQQEPTISLQWNQARTTLDARAVRGTYGYYSVTRNVVTEGDVHSNNWGFWVQDSWTLGRKLTINAGVRAENEHVPSYRDEFPGIDFSFGDKIAPRVGFAYDIKGDSRWKAYGSYGRYFDITKLEMPRGSFGAEHWITYYWTLDTFDWPNIKCQEGTTGCPGTFIEEIDSRHPANEADPRLTAYFGREQNTIDPNLKPVQTGEITFGLDHELSKSMSVGVRYTHKWLDRTIEDSGITIPNVGEIFFIANPGFGVADQILPEPAPPMPRAKRDYDGLEFRAAKRLGNRWSLNASYLYSRLFGNYSGLASSDENGRTSPNVNRFFDGLYLLYDAHGNAVEGLLQTDRPHYLKAQVTYDLPWGTLLGVNSQLQSGSPLQTTINWRGYNGVYVNGRNDLGRTPSFSQIDLFLQHDFRLHGHRVNLNVNIDNLFDQDTITYYTTSPYRDTFGTPGISTNSTAGTLSPSDAFFFRGFDVAAQAAAMRTAGSTMRDQPLFMKPSSFQGRRQIRLGIKYSF
jgi:hypothetical protein